MAHARQTEGELAPINHTRFRGESSAAHDRRGRMRARSTAALTAAVVATVAVAACGGNGHRGGGGASSSAKTSSATAIKPGKPGGKLTVLWADDVDFLDPGLTWSGFGYMVQYAVNRTLYSYKPDDSERPVPDLATGPPEISSDNKTITVHIKAGVKYAPPVNREVRAPDIRYAFERAFSKEVPSGYAGAYFNSIVGTPDKTNTGDIKPISGIETPDDTTIVFHLKTPSAPLVSQALVMPITVPVPKEYAARYDETAPSTYDQHVAFTGPYLVKNDPKTGRVTGRVPGKSIDIVRNPNWERSTDYRPAYLDAVFIHEGNTSALGSRRALGGSAMVCCDSPQPPAQVLKRALQHTRNQVLLVPAGGTHYISFNTTVKPFDNLNIRKAIIAFSNRGALRLTRGGATLGDIANGYIPPGIPGYEEAGGVKQNTDLDYLKNPNGDPALAKKYMRAAKQEDPNLPIDANGRWTGSDGILTMALNADPGKKTAEVFQSQMEQLGFKLNLRTISPDTLFTKFYGVPKANVALLPNGAWFKDFSDPQSMLDATFNGDNILQESNVNWSQLNVLAINTAMKAAALVPVGPERNKAWAKINHMIAAQAPAIPFIWDKYALVQSKDVVGVANAYYTAHDLAFTSLKE